MQKDLERLCSCLGNYPLAIQQAIAYLNEMMENASIDNFIEEYRNTVKIFEGKYAKQKFDDGYPHTVATVFNLSLEVIARTKKALEFLHVLSFCKPESTEVKFFERLYENASVIDVLAALMRFNLISRDPENTEIILVHRVVQRVVQDQVLSERYLIKIVFRAGIISMYPFRDRGKYSVSDLFPIIEHLSEKNEKIGQTYCTIHKIFDRDWNFVQKNETATFIVLSVAFFRFHSVSTLQEMFGAEKLQIAHDLLKHTCFRHTSDEYFFPKEINQIIWESTVRSKTLSSLLWDRLDGDKLVNLFCHPYQTTTIDLFKSNCISVQEKSLLFCLICEIYGIDSPNFTTFNKLYVELLKSKCIVVPSEVDELWLGKNYQDSSESRLLVFWYICDRMNWQEFIWYAIWPRYIEYKRTKEPDYSILYK